MFALNEMKPSDWPRCRQTLNLHAATYYPAVSRRSELLCFATAVVLWWIFGLRSLPGIAAVVVVTWFLHRILRKIAIDSALIEGYELGFQAGWDRVTQEVLETRAAERRELK